MRSLKARFVLLLAASALVVVLAAAAVLVTIAAAERTVDRTLAAQGRLELLAELSGRLTQFGLAAVETVGNPDGQPEAMGMSERRGEFGGACLVDVGAEDQLHHRRHWRASLRLHAGVMEQLGIFGGTRIGEPREIVGEAQRAVQRGAAFEARALRRLGLVARGGKVGDGDGDVVQASDHACDPRRGAARSPAVALTDPQPFRANLGA